MKVSKRFLCSSIVMLLLLNQFCVLAFCQDESNNTVTSSDFFASLGKMVSSYDSANLISDDENNSAISESNRLIVCTETNDMLTDDHGAIAKVEGWNSMHILQYETVPETEAAFEFFSNQSYVEYVEKDSFCYLMSAEGDDPAKETVEDPLSWGNNVVKSTAICKSLIENNVKLSEEVVVAVFDTGINANHEYFSPGRIKEGVNVFDQNNNTMDRNGHGSHVAGIIQNNTPTNVKIKPYKLNSKKFPYDEVAYSLLASAIFSCVDEGIDVINMSLSYDNYNYMSKYVSKAIDYAYNNNVPIVIAAGNDLEGEGKNVDDNFMIQSFKTISVAAVNKRLTPMLKSENGEASSNFGTHIDIAAPGEKINSVNFVNGYWEISGTSMATPFVTSAVAILKSIKPNITFDEIFSRIRNGAYVPANWNYLYGAGVLNIENMLSDLIASSPKISIDGQKIILTATTPNSKIYYTTDNTTPTINSNLYTEPIDTSGVQMVKAVAYKDGLLPSIVSAKSLIWHGDVSVYYKSSEKLPIETNSKIKKVYSSNPDVVTVDKNGNITGISAGEAKVTLYFESNEIGTYDVKVGYSFFQYILIIFCFGFLWYI